MIAFAVASIFALQAAGEAPIAIKNDAPETWTVEYPRVMTPYVQDYRQCLNYANRTIRGVADFEEQHRADLPRCNEVKSELITQSRKLVEQYGFGDEFTADDVNFVFDHIGRIHIARGADLDSQFTLRIARSAEAQDDYFAKERKLDPFVPLKDPSVAIPSNDQGQEATNAQD